MSQFLYNCFLTITTLAAIAPAVFLVLNYVISMFWNFVDRTPEREVSYKLFYKIFGTHGIVCYKGGWVRTDSDGNYVAKDFISTRGKGSLSFLGDAWLFDTKEEAVEHWKNHPRFNWTFAFGPLAGAFVVTLAYFWPTLGVLSVCVIGGLFLLRYLRDIHKYAIKVKSSLDAHMANPDAHKRKENT